MADKTESSPSTPAEFSTDAAVVQIREVVKWLIGGFAAVGVALAAGSQLSEIGVLEGGRLIVAIAAVVVTLAGIVMAIVSATKVLTPKPVGLGELAAGERTSETGKRIGQEPELLMGYGNSITEFRDKRDEMITDAKSAWKDYEGDESDPKLHARALRTQEEKSLINAAMRWLFSFSRYTETEKLFNRSLKIMVASAAIAALGIGAFAWAAHPEDDDKNDAATEAVVAKAPALVTVDLTPEGSEGLRDELGEECDLDAVKAIAVTGSAESPEVVSLPSEDCSLARFVVSGDIGTYQSLERLTREPEPASHG